MTTVLRTIKRARASAARRYAQHAQQEQRQAERAAASAYWKMQGHDLAREDRARHARKLADGAPTIGPAPRRRTTA